MLVFVIVCLVIIQVIVMGLGLIYEQTKHLGWKLNYVLVSGAIGLVFATAAILDYNSQFSNSSEELALKYEMQSKQLEAARTINAALQAKIHEAKEQPDQIYNNVIKIHIMFENGDEVTKAIQPGITTYRIRK